MNSTAFTPEEVKKGLHLDLINYLLSYNAKTEDGTFNDIHITTDGYCLVIEWEDVNREYSDAKFSFVDDGYVVMKEVILPDNSIEYALDEEHEEEIWKAFHENNPGWVKTSYGTWTNEIENEQFKKYLEGEDKKDEM